jgi:predicted nucleic acid-binding protein
MFWDSSALVPTLLPASESATLGALIASDSRTAVWWGSPVECQSAVYRRHRAAPLPAALVDQAWQRLATVMANVDVVQPTAALHERAGRLLAVHPLRAADAFQLAAALAWCDDSPRGESFVCLDERLRDAARRERFTILPG